MSVAFTKEESAETASETLLPDRPISPHPNLVTEAGLKALQSQLQEAREAYEAAQAIEDVNEKRRQSAVPLRDARYLTERLRTAQVIPDPSLDRHRRLRQHGHLQPPRRPRADLSHRRRGRSRSEGRVDLVRSPGREVADGEGGR